MSDFEPVRVSTGSSSETETTREQRERVEQARDDRTRSQQRVDISDGREVSRTGPRRAERDAVDEPSDSDDPGVVATTVGVVGREIGNTPMGRSVGDGFNRVFGDDFSDDGIASGVDSRLESAEQGFEQGVVNRIESAEVEDAGERFGRDVTAQTASFANPAGIARDALTATEAVGRGVQTVTGGPESVQSAGETTATVARASPDLARSGAQFVRENPRDAAVTGTALAATAGIGAAGVRGVRSGSTVARNQFRRGDSDSQPTTSVDTDTSTTAGITDDLPGVTVRRDPNRGRVDVDDLAVQQVDDLRQRVGDSIDTRIDITGSRVSSVADDATDTIESGARQVLEADSIADVAPVSARDLGRSFERTRQRAEFQTSVATSELDSRIGSVGDRAIDTADRVTSPIDSGFNRALDASAPSARELGRGFERGRQRAEFQGSVAASEADSRIGSVADRATDATQRATSPIDSGLNTAMDATPTSARELGRSVERTRQRAGFQQSVAASELDGRIGAVGDRALDAADRATSPIDSALDASVPSPRELGRGFERTRQRAGFQQSVAASELDGRIGAVGDDALDAADRATSPVDSVLDGAMDASAPSARELGRAFERGRQRAELEGSVALDEALSWARDGTLRVSPARPSRDVTRPGDDATDLQGGAFDTDIFDSDVDAPAISADRTRDTDTDDLTGFDSPSDDGTVALTRADTESPTDRSASSTESTPSRTPPGAESTVGSTLGISGVTDADSPSGVDESADPSGMTEPFGSETLSDVNDPTGITGTDSTEGTVEPLGPTEPVGVPDPLADTTAVTGTELTTETTPEVTTQPVTREVTATPTSRDRSTTTPTTQQIGSVDAGDAVTAGAESVAQTTAPRSSSPRPSRPRGAFLPPFGDDDSDVAAFGVEQDADTFETGILSGSDAASQIGSR